MSVKGQHRRPQMVSDEEMQDNWDATFGPGDEGNTWEFLERPRKLLWYNRTNDYRFNWSDVWSEEEGEE